MGEKVVVKNRRARLLLRTIVSLAVASTLLACSAERREGLVKLSDVAKGEGGFVIRASGFYFEGGPARGQRVSNAGDVNGDGLDDIIIGLPNEEVGGKSEAGKSYVVFGKANGTTVELSRIDNGTGGFVINGIDKRDRSGYSVSGAGDVNGDGLDDLIVSAPFARAGHAKWAGETYVVFGKANGTAVELSSIAMDANTDGFVINGIGYSHHAGLSVSGAGDVNGDGLDDIIIGAPHANADDGKWTGESYVVFGKPSGTVVELSNIRRSSDPGGFVINGVRERTGSGIDVSGAGDLNGDGLDDLVLVAIWIDGDIYTHSAESYVVFGKASGTAVNLSDVALDNNTGGFIIKGINADWPWGVSVSNAGDVNGDGLGDLIFGVPANTDHSGRCYVVFGKASGTAVYLSDSVRESRNYGMWTYTTQETSIATGIGGFVINGIDGSLATGASVSGAGDVNGDGLDDLIVGVAGHGHSTKFNQWTHSGNWRDAGESYVVFGKSNTAAVELSKIASTVGGFRISGIPEVYKSGISVSGAGDVNGDGLDDLIVGDSVMSESGLSCFVVFSPMAGPKHSENAK
ncbi:MAG: FG-GAP repeat protein [Candidatus Hydrogenedentes bacterium]|nr:FG-GAP repeat protein [Candidatus Hydrogenedentota bacterium]